MNINVSNLVHAIEKVVAPGIVTRTVLRLRPLPRSCNTVESIIYETLGRCEGIISAEHGIGLDKRDYLM